MTNQTVVIRGSFLRRYLAGRQLTLVTQARVTQHEPGPPAKWVKRSETLVTPDMRVEVWGGGWGIRYQAIHLLAPAAQELCGVWPFEPPRQYCDFIVDVDEVGRAVEHTSDVDHASGPFLTPVFFRRTVLDRYYGDSDRYQVSDGVVHGPTFGLPVDNDHTDVVSAYLGDLGRLPHSEQQHWRAHNISPTGTISETAYRRDFLAQFADADHVDHRFQASYELLIEAWTARFGWPVYLPPAAGDEHVLSGIHVPTNASFGAFDDEIVLLAKCTVDFLNEAQLAAGLSTTPNDKGIQKLDTFLSTNSLPGGLPPVLRAVQGARTNSGAHRKSSSFDLSKLLNGAPDPLRLFEQLLAELVEAMDALRAAL